MAGKQKPTFILIDRLPSEHHASVFLGRIVADIFHPIHEYCPENPSKVLEHAPVDVTDTNVSTVLAAGHSKSLRAKLDGVFGLSHSSGSNVEKQLVSTKILTRSLPQHRKSFAAIDGAYHDEVLELLTNNAGKGYMVVGIKTCLSAELEIKRDGHKENEANVAVPAGAIASAALHGAISPASIPNPSLEGSYIVHANWLARNVAEGEQIFALQYRQINLKKHFFSGKPSSADYGRIKMVDWGDGVYGGDSQGRDVVYEDDGTDNEEDEEEEDSDIQLAGVLSPEDVEEELKEFWLIE